MDSIPSGIEGSTSPGPDYPRSSQSGGENLAALNRAIAARKVRQRHFPGGLFGDPAWELTLELYAAWLQQHRLTVSALCTRAGAPLTTGIRSIGMICDAGYAFRVRDPLDRRRVFVELSDNGARAMKKYFEALTHAEDAVARPDGGG